MSGSSGSRTRVGNRSTSANSGPNTAATEPMASSRHCRRSKSTWIAAGSTDSPSSDVEDLEKGPPDSSSSSWKARWRPMRSAVPWATRRKARCSLRTRPVPRRGVDRRGRRARSSGQPAARVHEASPRMSIRDSRMFVVHGRGHRRCGRSRTRGQGGHAELGGRDIDADRRLRSDRRRAGVDPHRHRRAWPGRPARGGRCTRPGPRAPRRTGRGRAGRPSKPTCGRSPRIRSISRVQDAPGPTSMNRPMPSA